MAGLLGDSFDDPRTMATLQLAAGLLGPGSFGQGLSRGLMGYQGTMSNAADIRLKDQRVGTEQQMGKLRELQMQQAAAQLADQQRQRDFLQTLPSPQALANEAAFAATGAPMGTTAAAAAMPQGGVQGNQQLLDAVRAGVVSYPEYLAATRVNDTPIKLGAGDKLVAPRTFKELASNPKAEALDPLTQLISRRDALPPGDPRRTLYDAAINKATTHTPGTQVNVNTAQNPLFSGLGGFAAKQFEESTTQAQAAVARIEANSEVSRLLNSGSVYLGTGAESKLALGKALQSVGINLDPDATRNTELLGTRLADRTLKNIKASGLGAGQGFTDKDREFLQQAVGGTVSIQGSVLKRLIELDSKAARATIEKHNKLVTPIQNSPQMKGFPMDFTVAEPPQAAPASGVRRYNPQTGKIE